LLDFDQTNLLASPVVLLPTDDGIKVYIRSTTATTSTNNNNNNNNNPVPNL
jgi:hypothetical protein